MKRTIKIKPKPQRKPKTYDFDGLCNRLQSSDPALGLMEISVQLGLSGSISDNDILTAIAKRAHLTMHTRMGTSVCFVAECRKQVGSGYVACLQPPKYSISSSHSLIAAATVAYVQLCKQFGAFQ